MNIVLRTGHMWLWIILNYQWAVVWVSCCCRILTTISITEIMTISTLVTIEKPPIPNPTWTRATITYINKNDYNKNLLLLLTKRTITTTIILTKCSSSSLGYKTSARSSTVVNSSGKRWIWKKWDTLILVITIIVIERITMAFQILLTTKS